METSNLVTLKVSEAVFNDLKAMAEPLVDNTDTVLMRLIRHWRENPPSAQPRVEPRYWTSARGEKLPIGLKLRATYLGKTVEAVIEKTGIQFAGKIYSSPSNAAIAAKRSLGAKGSAANQNGWDFWEYLSESTNEWHFLRGLR